MGWQDDPVVSQSAADPLDFSNRYNTKLNPQQEQAFQAWAQKQGPRGSSYDYDMRGAFASGATQSANGHFPDTFKKPNHPTFSDQSQYSGVDGNEGGKWAKQSDGSWSFTPSASSLKMHDAGDLQTYFQKVEPGNKLILPSQPDQSSVGAGSWKDDPVVTSQALAAPEPPTDIGRQVALGGRAVGEGVGGTLLSAIDQNPVNIVSQALTGKTPQQLSISAVNHYLGAHLPQMPSYSELLSKALTYLGAPTPETSGEQLGSAAIRGASGALTLGGLGGVATVPNAIRAGVSGATGATASEYARQQGAGPVGQFVAGLAGGFAPTAIEEAARGGANLVANIARPLTRAGQEQIAGQVLARQATNPQAAVANLETAQPIVPGSARTAGEASQDLGLMALEKGVRGRSTADFGQRISEQNAARQAELGSVAGTPADMAAAKVARDAQTAPMREQALGSGVADPAPIHATIDSILSSPVGKRETVSKALEWAKGLIGDETNPASLYEIRKDLQLAQQGKLQPSSANAPNASTLATARGQLGQVVSSLDDSIEAAAPGFKAYLQRYRDLSQPIDQMKVIQEIQRRAQLTSADVTTGQNFIGNANFSRALDAAIQKNGAKLTADQIERLNAIRTDLQMGQAINSPLIKVPGSDTFQNLSIAQAIGAGAGGAHPIIRVLTKPLSWIYKFSGSDEGINEVLTRAMLDPKLSAAMLKRATPASVGAFSARLRAATIGASAGMNTTNLRAPLSQPPP